MNISRKTAAARLGLVAALVVFLSLIQIQGCGSDTSGPEDVGGGVMRGSLVSATSCKDPEFLGTDAAPADLDCINWDYGSSGDLSIIHVNAGLNCCPGRIQADIMIRGDSILVKEDEGEDSYPCRCLCLYDLEYEFTGIDEGTYTVIFIEENLPDGDKPLAVTVDLAAEPEGSLCLPRTNYPWGQEYHATEPTGVLESSSSCSGDRLGDFPADQSCVTLTYDLAGEHLSIGHHNTALNCCIDSFNVTASYSFGADTIVIEEKEYPEWGLCDCICLHDVSHEIYNLEPGVYTFKFIEHYLPPGEDVLEFTVDLEEIAVGSPGYVFCLERQFYPWGMSEEERDKMILQGMYEDIVDYIGTPECEWEMDCRVIGVGSKPCGGPWHYLVYSASTLDESVLFDLVAEHAAFEDYMNRKYHYISTCDVPPVPETECVGGVCRAVYPAR